jgi:hypothetical protein
VYKPVRRTFITVTESIGLQTYAIKRMVNRKMQGDMSPGAKSRLMWIGCVIPSTA